MLLNDIIPQVVTSIFAEDLLEVDAALWGGFWQFDVLSPGYRLPVAELALLRAIRLDGQWPEETTSEQFLADLRTAITHPQAGVWTLIAGGEPCVIFAAPFDTAHNPKSKTCAERSRSIQNPKLVTVVWYCVTTERLHAGYRTTPDGLYMKEASLQREPAFNIDPGLGQSPPATWLTETLQQKTETPAQTLAERLDVEILQIRIARATSE